MTYNLYVRCPTNHRANRRCNLLSNKGRVVGRKRHHAHRDVQEHGPGGDRQPVRGKSVRLRKPVQVRLRFLKRTAAKCHKVAKESYLCAMYIIILEAGTSDIRKRWSCEGLELLWCWVTKTLKPDTAIIYNGPSPFPRAADQARAKGSFGYQNH